MVVAIASVAVAQDLTYGNDDDRAYCKYITEQSRAQALQYYIPSFTSGVTQPNTGTSPQTFAGLSGSIANLRKGKMVTKIADQGCKLYTATDAVDNAVKYAMVVLQKDSLAHRLEAVRSGLTKINGLLVQGDQEIAAHTTTKFATYALQTAKQQLIGDESNLQGQIAYMFIPDMSNVPLYRLVTDKQALEVSNQQAIARLAKQSNWDLQWEVGAHRTLSSSTNTLGGNTSGAFAGFNLQYNLGSRSINKHFDNAAKAYGDWKQVEGTDIVQGANTIQAQVNDALVATDKRIRELREQQTELEANFNTVKDAETNIGKTFINQLVADRVLMEVELSDAQYRRQQLGDYLAFNFPTVPGSAVARVSLTFDDGFLSQYTAALPILDKAGMKGTFFIVTNYLGRPVYMTQDQVKKLQADGQEIGSHTRNHKHLPTLSADEQDKEIAGTINDFETLGLKRPVSMAYPFGEYNDDSFASLRKGGFRTARTVDERLTGQNPFLLQGLSLNNHSTFGQVKLAIDNARRNGTWLIIVFHRVGESPANEINISPELFQQIVDYLAQTKTQVVTVDAATNAPLVATVATKQPVPAATKPLF